MHALGRILDSADMLLVFTTLEALEKVGTPATMPYVNRIVKSGQTPMIRDLAHRVMTTLEGRKRRQGDSEQLGRPVLARAELHAGELLRADSRDDLDDELI